MSYNVFKRTLINHNLALTHSVLLLNLSSVSSDSYLAVFLIKLYIGLGLVGSGKEISLINRRQLPDRKITWLSVLRSATSLHWKRFQSSAICWKAFQCKAFQREREGEIMAPLEHLKRRYVGGMDGITKGFHVAQFSICEMFGFHFIAACTRVVNWFMCREQNFTAPG